MQTTIGKTTLRLVTGDIADQDTDAVVTAAHWRLNKCTGTDGTIHTKGGPAIYEECRSTEIVPLLAQEIENGLERHRGGQPHRIAECPGRDGRERDAVQPVLDRDLQAPAVGAGQQLRFILVAGSPDGTNCVYDMPGLEIAAGGDDRIPDWAAADAGGLDDEGGSVNFKVEFVYNA